jgi:serine/threonine protein kinase
LFFYRSPERVEGGSYTFSSDIWSLGVTVYEMVTGRHPYPDINKPIALYEMIRSHPSPSLAGIEGISNELVDFVNIW